ncbi:unnamed protein product [Rodentolepis nana]|uniref:Battenin n=1 Tax=Rodentolepis nana TaxID=102285 RepID=A0A0R3TA40_RODNA|nr:unnamed protein product [Rodentolepis nana]
MPFHTIERFWQVWRNSIAFWLFGIFNNFIYVVMLSAAVDILEKNHPKESSDLNTNGQVNCTEMGTGAILLADIGPSLILKFVSPLFIRRIHFHLKVFLCALFALSGFLIVSFSKSIHSSLFGVVLGSISCGLGDVTFLTMVAFFDVNEVSNYNFAFSGVVSAWSSGTGAAGVVGALSYAAMTSLWSPEVVLRIITLAPLSLLFVYVTYDIPLNTNYFTVPPFSYFVVLKKPRNSVFQLSSLRFTRLIRTSQFPDSSEHDIPIQQSFSEDGADSPSNRQPLLRSDDTPTVQISPSWEDKKRIFMDIFPLIFALALVYFFEYLINQALFELVYFKDAGMTQAQQYRWYQVIYQCGVFASRSSLKLFKVHRIWIMAVLQVSILTL